MELCVYFGFSAIFYILRQQYFSLLFCLAVCFWLGENGGTKLLFADVDTWLIASLLCPGNCVKYAKI